MFGILIKTQRQICCGEQAAKLPESENERIDLHSQTVEKGARGRGGREGGAERE